MHNRIPRPAAVPRSDADTPPSGFTLPADFADFSQAELSAYFAEHARATRQEIQRIQEYYEEHEARRDSDRDQDRERVDGLLKDVRALTTETRRALAAARGADGKAESTEAAIEKLNAEVLRLGAVAGKLEGVPNSVQSLLTAGQVQQQVIARQAAQHAELGRTVEQLAKTVAAVNDRVGVPPELFEARISQVGELTAAERVELETNGTGLYGAVSKNSAAIDRLLKRVAIVTAATTAATTIGGSLLPELLKYLF